MKWKDEREDDNEFGDSYKSLSIDTYRLVHIGTIIIGNLGGGIIITTSPLRLAAGVVEVDPARQISAQAKPAVRMGSHSLHLHYKSWESRKLIMAPESLPFIGGKSLHQVHPSPLLSRTLAQTRYKYLLRISTSYFILAVFVCFLRTRTSSLLVRYSKTLPEPFYRARWRRRSTDDDAKRICIGLSPRTRWRFINYFRKKGGKVFPITVFCEGLPRATRQGVRLMATRTHRFSSSSSSSSSSSISPFLLSFISLSFSAHQSYRPPTFFPSTPCFIISSFFETRVYLCEKGIIYWSMMRDIYF